MIRRQLCIASLLLLSFQYSFAQSLGDVARATRAERQTKASPRTKIITNEDLARSEPAPQTSSIAGAEVDTSKAPENTDTKLKEENAPAKTTESADAQPGPQKPALSEREKQELELQKRTDEINQRYLARISDLRNQIEAAKADVKKLEALQQESTYQFRRTNGVSPNPGTYDQQQRTFNEQIESRQQQIVTLTSQLEDAKEAARHAGVPHATD